MIRILAWALVAAVAAGTILTQLQGTAELAFWEVLLVALVVLQYRGIPDRNDPLERPLFSLSVPEPRRLPRDVASMELAVIDATSGYLGPDRRLRPALIRVAQHRLARLGHDLDSEAAFELLGEEQWTTLMSKGEESMSAKDLQALVSRLEEI